MPVHWLNVGTGECIDNDDNPQKTANHVYAHGPAPTLTTLAVCKAACEQGQSICAGIATYQLASIQHGWPNAWLPA